VDVFGVLIRLFFSRFFDKSALSPQGEPEADVVQILGILAAPGAFVALLFLFLPLTTSGWDLIAVRCLFLSFSMAVMGFIVAFEWDVCSRITATIRSSCRSPCLCGLFFSQK
jgi:hypothetical protein